MAADVVKREGGPIGTLRDMLEANKSKIQDALPRHMTADRLMRVAIAACGRTPKLLECTPISVCQAVMQAAQLGLEPGNGLGDAYLVPYGKECQLIPGYRGLINLARRSGQIQTIEAHVVHERDEFECTYGLTPTLKHDPCWESNPGEVTAAYAIARLKDGGVQVEVMTRAQVDAIRKRSKAGTSGPWVTDFDEMARKTVVRRLCKYLPLSPELADALSLDAQAEEIEIPAEVRPAGTAGTDALKQKLGVTPGVDPVTGEVVDEDPELEAKKARVREQAAAARAGTKEPGAEEQEAIRQAELTEAARP